MKDNNDLIAPKKKILSSRKGLKIKCKVCQKAFLRELLKKHMRIAHSNVKIPQKKFTTVEDGRVQCLDCNKSYSNISIAKTHYKNLHLAKKFGKKTPKKLDPS